MITLTQVWGVLLILTVCPILGGMPLIAWITKTLTGLDLRYIGTGNISVSAAFYHGGRWAGILAVLSEAGKGIAAVLLARIFFDSGSEWELIALTALVLGRYYTGKGAGTTNVVWGVTCHDPSTAGLVFLIGGVSFTLLRERELGRLGVLVIFPVILALLHPENGARVGAAVILSLVLAWIYRQIPDDLDLPATSAQQESEKVFRFFRGDRAIVTLDRPLDARKTGQKAATLSQLKRWGYPVPMGWVLPAGDDPQPLLDLLQPSRQCPLVVRSSAVGEDTEQASAAGQYDSILNITNSQELQEAIAQCLASYDSPAAQIYRRDRQLPEDSMSVLVQQQIQGTFSGVAFSRDPIDNYANVVVIEALPGDCRRIVSGQVTPELYRVHCEKVDLAVEGVKNGNSWLIPPDLELPVEGEGDIPPALIKQVAYLARHLEARYHGIPQDIEWSYDGQHLWLLQTRPVTTLFPIWTRKIAAEVIPGLIRPLTWSINKPLTCGVWGELFTLVLGKKAAGLDFNQTATLHFSRAYFNATLLGQIFRKMGLPAESLEFLTRGAKFSKPPLNSTLQQLPGLLRLLKREWSLEKDFERDYREFIAPISAKISPPIPSEPEAILARIDLILELLKKVTYYSILAPLSFALRQKVLKVRDEDLDNSQLPEVSALRILQQIAAGFRRLLPNVENLPQETEAVFAQLAQIPLGKMGVMQQFEDFLERYGYLSDAATDIAVPRWKENSQTVLDLLVQYIFQPAPPLNSPQKQSWQAKIVQRRLNLKGQVTAIYSQFLAELRWGFTALEKIWIGSEILREEGDIFYLELEEIRRLVAGEELLGDADVTELIESRKNQLEKDGELGAVPFVVYGNNPPVPVIREAVEGEKQLQGIGASPGVVEGRIKIVCKWQSNLEVDRNTILVVPYTDSGWAPLLARAGGLISEVGGRLSHGAIVAREYGIPAVMDIHNATHILRDGQWVRIDGSAGIIEVQI